jgi:hypothetical protein
MRLPQRIRWTLFVLLALFPGWYGFALQPTTASSPGEGKTPTHAQLTRECVLALVKMQDRDGEWPYEGVVKVNKDLPVGYRVGGTAIVATTLLLAAPDDSEASAAIDRALGYVLKELHHPLMAPSTENKYDVRIWGHAYALEFLCHIRAAKRAGDRAGGVKEWIPRLVQTIVTEEIDGGGWNYANRRTQASFVTAPVAQALLLARAQGEKVPDKVLLRARKVLEDSRNKEHGGFAYSGPSKGKSVREQPPGSAARSAVCETTLVLLGGGSTEAVQGAVEMFFKHWDELHKRHQQKGTHKGPYQIAPYYFYYGHRHAAQAIALLPEKARAAERDRLLQVILKTRDKDGTWNDRVFERSRNYGTAMVLLALLAEKAPLPPRYEKGK